MQTYINFGLIDVVGKRYVENSYMTVENGVIRSVGSMASLTQEQKQGAVDLSGKTVMPGHVQLPHSCAFITDRRSRVLELGNVRHVCAARSRHLQQQLQSGVTFVRDMNGRQARGS